MPNTRSPDATSRRSRPTGARPDIVFIVADESERASLAAQEPNSMETLRRAWLAWNETLPPIPNDATVSLGCSVVHMPQR